MSWDPKDYHQGPVPGGAKNSLPQLPMDDDEPLPTYMVGLETYDDDSQEDAPLWQQQDLRRQGYLTGRQLDWWAHIVRRGIVEV